MDAIWEPLPDRSEAMAILLLASGSRTLLLTPHLGSLWTMLGP